MDETNKKILNELQIDSSRKISELASKLNLPRTTVHNRIKKLEKNKTILQQKAILDMEKVGKPICALVHIVITSKESVHEVAQKLKRDGKVEEVHVIAGQFDIIAKVRLKDNAELSEFIFHKTKGLRSWPSVERTESMIVLDTVKENGVIRI